MDWLASAYSGREMSDFGLIICPEQAQAFMAMLVASLRLLPPAAVLYGVGCVAHMLGWRWLIPWVYPGLAIAAVTFG
jgi:hypothetical protein